MAISAEDFKHGMRQLGGAVTVVTTADGDSRAGLTATAVTSLSAEPPRLIACINRAGTTYETLSRGRVICVNLLCVQDRALAEQFAGMDGSPESQRFNSDRWTVLETGAPVLEGALASFDCRVDSVLDVGSHGVVIGDIVALTVSEMGAQPLCYRDGDWSTLAPLAALGTPA